MDRTAELDKAKAFFQEEIPRALAMVAAGTTNSFVAQTRSEQVVVLTDRSGGKSQVFVSATSPMIEPLQEIMDNPPPGATCTLIDVKRFGRFCLRIYPS